MQPERPVQTTLAFHASRIVIDAGVLLAMASMSMSFVVSSTGNRSALDADAFPVIILLAPIFAVTLIPDQTRPLHPIAGWGALAFGLAALPYSLVKLSDAAILADTLDGSVGFGARLLVIGCVVVLVGIGIGIYRNLRGLPAGGTPGRTARFRTGSKSPSEPESKSGADPKPGSDSKSAPDSDPGSDPDQEAVTSDTAPTRLVPVVEEGKASRASAQPEIVFPDTGAVAREADPDVTEANPLLDTAERADAAIDDHLMSMFDDDESDDTDDSGDSDD